MHSPFKDNTPALLNESGPGLAKNASFHVDCVFVFTDLSVFLPALCTDQFNKSATPQIGFMKAIFTFGYFDQIL
jgi:hypothetical protein